MEIWLRSFKITHSILKSKGLEYWVREFESAFQKMETEEKLRWFPMFLKEKSAEEDLMTISYWEGLHAWLPLNDWGEGSDRLNVHPSIRILVLNKATSEVLGVQAGCWALYVYEGVIREMLLSKSKVNIIESLSEDISWSKESLVSFVSTELKLSKESIHIEFQEMLDSGLIRV